MYQWQQVKEEKWWEDWMRWRSQLLMPRPGSKLEWDPDTYVCVYDESIGNFINDITVNLASNIMHERKIIVIFMKDNMNKYFFQYRRIAITIS